MLFTPADQENLIWTRLILCRPYGTVPGRDRYPGLRPGLHSAVPTGLGARTQNDDKGNPYPLAVRDLP